MLAASWLWFGQAHAACTYNEAIMAFSNGNTVRGQALMNMAARDGDERAVRYLAAKGKADPALQRLARNTQSEKRIVMDASQTALDVN